MSLPEPRCEMGYTYRQIMDIMGDRLEEFHQWMNGQTMSLCEGRRYDHDTKQYVTSCDGNAHGGIVYPWDVQRFLDGRPIID